MIRFLHREQIDIEKWDDVISNSSAETIYPYSWYLDAAADTWSALVMDDYSCVMPLIWRKKFGISYLYHPNFVQQLGVFSKEFVDPLIVKNFLNHIPSKFKYGNLRFNTGNLVGDEEYFEVSDRSNYELQLKQDYETLLSGYSTNTKRNLKKSNDSSQQIVEDVSLEELIKLKKENDILSRDASYFNWMEQLFATALKHSGGMIIGARSDNELSAAAIFAYCRKRAIYMLSVSNESGKESRAMFGVVDRFIQVKAGSDIVLDFEGSQIESIARFFSGFGATPMTYQSVDFARFPVSLVKRKRNG